MVLNVCQVAIIMSGITCQSAWPMQTPFELQMEQARASFTDYLNTTESQLASLQAVQNVTHPLLRGTVNALTSFASKTAGYGNVTADEMVFVNRFFEDKEKKEQTISDFLKNPAPFTPHIKAVFWQFQQRQKTETQLDPINLLIEVLHKETAQRLKQPATITRAQMAQKALAKKEKSNEPLIADEDYYPVVLTNFFATHMFEKFFKGQ